MKSILIADNAYEPAFSLAKKLHKQKKLVTVLSSSESNFTNESKTAPVSIKWERCSPLSAVTCLHYAEKKGESIKYAIVFFNPTVLKNSSKKDSNSLSEIDKLLDCKLKSLLFLLRELEKLFLIRKKGIIIPVLFTNGQILSKYDRVIATAFKTIIDEMIIENNTNYSVIGVDTGALDVYKTNEFLSNLIETLNTERTKKKKIKSKWMKPDSINNIRQFAFGRRN